MEMYDFRDWIIKGTVVSLLCSPLDCLLGRKTAVMLEGLPGYPVILTCSVATSAEWRHSANSGLSEPSGMMIPPGPVMPSHSCNLC